MTLDVEAASCIGGRAGSTGGDHARRDHAFSRGSSHACLSDLHLAVRAEQPRAARVEIIGLRDGALVTRFADASALGAGARVPRCPRDPPDAVADLGGDVRLSASGPHTRERGYDSSTRDAASVHGGRVRRGTRPSPHWAADATFLAECSLPDAPQMAIHLKRDAAPAPRRSASPAIVLRLLTAGGAVAQPRHGPAVDGPVVLRIRVVKELEAVMLVGLDTGHARARGRVVRLIEERGSPARPGPARSARRSASWATKWSRRGRALRDARRRRAGHPITKP